MMMSMTKKRMASLLKPYFLEKGKVLSIDEYIEDNKRPFSTSYIRKIFRTYDVMYKYMTRVMEGSWPSKPKISAAEAMKLAEGKVEKEKDSND